MALVLQNEVAHRHLALPETLHDAVGPSTVERSRRSSTAPRARPARSRPSFGPSGSPPPPARHHRAPARRLGERVGERRHCHRARLDEREARVLDARDGERDAAGRLPDERALLRLEVVLEQVEVLVVAAVRVRRPASSSGTSSRAGAPLLSVASRRGSSSPPRSASNTSTSSAGENANELPVARSLDLELPYPLRRARRRLIGAAISSSSREPIPHTTPK